MSTPEVIAEQESLQSLNADTHRRANGFHDAENYLYKAPKGLTRELVAKISEFKNEPGWMTDFRLKSYDYFVAREQPTWGSPMLAEVDYDDIHYFAVPPSAPSAPGTTCPRRQEHVDRLGIPEPSASSWPASARSTSPRSSTTR